MKASKVKATGKMVLLALAAVLIWWLQNRDGPLTGARAPEGGSGYAWVDHRHNDGDSFHIRTPDGEEMEIRLYYVDAPESALKSYSDGNNNHKRIDDQARDLGLDRNRTVKVGQMAKEWMKQKLRGKNFTVETYGEEVFNGPRVYAFVKIEEDGQDRYLHELLVEEGLVRIHTKGAELPNGTSRSKQDRRLQELQREAKKSGQGAWGL